MLSGNSCHLAPWHAKLGFQRSPFVATMHSLTPDGGLIAAMNLEIVKVYPVAYLEFKEDESGRKYREGPRPEADEMVEREKWNVSCVCLVAILDLMLLCCRMLGT